MGARGHQYNLRSLTAVGVRVMRVVTWRWMLSWESRGMLCRRYRSLRNSSANSFQAPSSNSAAYGLHAVPAHPRRRNQCQCRCQWQREQLSAITGSPHASTSTYRCWHQHNMRSALPDRGCHLRCCSISKGFVTRLHCARGALRLNKHGCLKKHPPCCYIYILRRLSTSEHVALGREHAQGISDARHAIETQAAR